MKKQYVSILLRLGLSIVLLGLLFVVIDRDALLQTLSSINIAHYLAGLGVYFLVMGLWGLRWHLFIRAAKEPVGFDRTLGTLFIGMFYAMFLPTIVGTDVGRMYELGRDAGSNKTNVVSTVLFDRLIGMISLVMMAIVGLIIGYQFAGTGGVVSTVLVALAALTVGWLLFFNRPLVERLFSVLFRLPLLGRLEHTIRELYEALFLLHNQPRLLFSSLAISLLYTAAETVAVMLVAKALGVEVEPIYYFIFMPIIWLILVVPISISGLGLREGAFVFLFTQVGMASADAVAISLLLYSYGVVVGLVGGLVLLRFSFAEFLRKAARKSAMHS